MFKFEIGGELDIRKIQTFLRELDPSVGRRVELGLFPYKAH